jgi:hypothetical protein
MSLLTMATTTPDTVRLENSVRSVGSGLPVCCCGWADKCVEIQQVLQEGKLPPRWIYTDETTKFGLEWLGGREKEDVHSSYESPLWSNY